MAEFTLNVPNDKVPRVKAALLGLFGSRLPVEATADPEADPPVPGWDDARKMKWILRDWLILQDSRWRRAQAKDEHVDPITNDQTIVDPVE